MSLPETFAAFATTCIDCGDQVAAQYLDEDGRCVGCRKRGEWDGE